MNLVPAISAAFAWGLLKSKITGATGGSLAVPTLLGDAGEALLEEAEFRLIGEGALRWLGASDRAAGVISSLAFGMFHGGSPLRMADAAAGGFLYSHVNREHGFWAAVATHFAHNLGIEVGAR